MSKIFAIAGAMLALLVVGIVGVLILQPPGDLITDAGFSLSTISPNADGIDDIATFSYGLSRQATVTITLTSPDGHEYIFRHQQERTPRHYSVNFSGVVDGFSLPNDPPINGTIERRLLPNGTYSWTLTAVPQTGKAETRTGTLTIQDADTQLPIISAFDISSERFTPNQDGVRDRVRVNVYLEKSAHLEVYLQDELGNKIYLAERLLGRDPGDQGNHEYDYDGGVDDGYAPPPDGTYTLYAIAQDDEGQRIVRTASLTIQDGGLPQVEIAPQPVGGTVCFSVQPWDGELIEKPVGSCSTLTTLTLRQGDLLVFKLSIWNYGETPIRTQGPFAGTVYEFDQLASSLGFIERDGTYRIGIHCESAISDHPWRWALGSLDDLTVINDPELNDTFYYLMPGQRTEVWGAIRMTEIREEQNPQDCYASLIHQGVGTEPSQLGVGRRAIRIDPHVE